MTQLLHWAVKHSDPEQLKEVLRKYKENNLTLKDVYGQDVMDALFINEGSVMKHLIHQVADFRNASLEDEFLEEALDRLRDFVDQVDNAGNLHRMGGLAPLLELALSPGRSLSTRARALWTLGVSVQNNAPVQADLSSLDALRRLAAELPRCAGRGGAGEEAQDALYCGKLLFAISGLLKNDASTQAKANSLGVFDWLITAGTCHSSLPVAKKSLGLLDIVLAQNPGLPFLAGLPGPEKTLARALLAHVRGETGAEESDTEAAEKALRLIVRLLSLRPALFPISFREELQAAAALALSRCERAFGFGDELCKDLLDFVDAADRMLAAHHVPDSEL